MSITVHHADCVEFLQERAKLVAAGEAEPFAAAVTDPPYHLSSITKRLGKPGSKPIVHGTDGAYARAAAGFMGKAWDGGDVAARPETWRAVYQNLKPGAWLIAFGGTRTYHRMVCAIEDAGFEIRDGLFDLVGSDTFVQRFLASLSEAQQLAFAQCVEESGFGGLLAWIYGSGFPKSRELGKAIDKHLGVKGSYGAAKTAAHQGWIDRGRMRSGEGHEGYQRPWMGDADAVADAARLYIPGSPEAAPWAGWGTALKPAVEPICLARKPLEGSVAANVLRHGVGALHIDACRIDAGKGGRWPANVLHDGSEDALREFPHTESGPMRAGTRRAEKPPPSAAMGSMGGNAAEADTYGDAGSAGRFFYSAKAGELDRLGSPHPTIKPVELMRYLVRLVCPPGGLILDPFAGSGSTGIAAIAEGMRAELIDIEADHVADIERKLAVLRGEGRHLLVELNERRAATAADRPRAPDLFSGVGE